MVRGREEFKSHKKVTIIAEPKLRREKLKMHEGEIEGTKIIKGKERERKRAFKIYKKREPHLKSVCVCAERGKKVNKKERSKGS